MKQWKKAKGKCKSLETLDLHRNERPREQGRDKEYLDGAEQTERERERETEAQKGDKEESICPKITEPIRRETDRSINKWKKVEGRKVRSATTCSQSRER